MPSCLLIHLNSTPNIPAEMLKAAARISTELLKASHGNRKYPNTVEIDQVQPLHRLI